MPESVYTRAQHRIRAAGILLQQQHILLLKVKDHSGEYWLPPGGGFEEGDASTKACLRREFLEEAGLDVEVGELLAVREFLETTVGRYNAEFFYHISDYRGEPHIANLDGLNDQEFIQQVSWVPISQLDNLRTYPADLSTLVARAERQAYSLHLGSFIQGVNESVNQL
ncbi:NUDIX domain-containing protein [Aliagarivorans taiwanensis]|uniref:NUDIX domain-containing protein n=1 Tax=Aliagarivorans taiwanensis TaxID=561966 RepID=UPI0003F7E5CB|nr:NUDIX domain-containing protein [Aliagarivorans taiwanensis]